MITFINLLSSLALCKWQFWSEEGDKCQIIPICGHMHAWGQLYMDGSINISSHCTFIRTTARPYIYARVNQNSNTQTKHSLSLLMYFNSRGCACALTWVASGGILVAHFWKSSLLYLGRIVEKKSTKCSMEKKKLNWLSLHSQEFGLQVRSEGMFWRTFMSDFHKQCLIYMQRLQQWGSYQFYLHTYGPSIIRDPLINRNAQGNTWINN